MSDPTQRISDARQALDEAVEALRPIERAPAGEPGTALSPVRLARGETVQDRLASAAAGRRWKVVQEVRWVGPSDHLLTPAASRQRHQDAVKHRLAWAGIPHPTREELQAEDERLAELGPDPSSVWTVAPIDEATSAVLLHVLQFGDS